MPALLADMAPHVNFRGQIVLLQQACLTCHGTRYIHGAGNQGNHDAHSLYK